MRLIDNNFWRQDIGPLGGQKSTSAFWLPPPPHPGPRPEERVKHLPAVREDGSSRLEQRLMTILPLRSLGGRGEGRGEVRVRFMGRVKHLAAVRENGSSRLEQRLMTILPLPPREREGWGEGEPNANKRNSRKTSLPQSNFR